MSSENISLCSFDKSGDLSTFPFCSVSKMIALNMFEIYFIYDLPKKFIQLGVAFMVTVILAGCSSESGPKLGTVSGMVMVDGQPLSGVVVNFSPENGERASYAITDDNGYYKLRFSSKRMGALPGRHRVQVTPNGLEVSTEIPPEEWTYKVPQHYSGKHFLIQVIEAGHNNIDLNLSSDPDGTELLTLDTSSQ
ncbi:carboxypeptidase-like regulatory domain-containing protein [uncultured Rubinisphaera sp.]|uniref:carboxypeptidase-like regulatory domain-containing protein n=1 Tax=uncultured Rubinisphaera sp. TaxID=1678686 RepID=UPI0030DD6737